MELPRRDGGQDTLATPSCSCPRFRSVACRSLPVGKDEQELERKMLGGGVLQSLIEGVSAVWCPWPWSPPALCSSFSLNFHVHINTGTHGMLDGSTVFWLSQKTLQWLDPKELSDAPGEDKINTLKKLKRHREAYWYE